MDPQKREHWLIFEDDSGEAGEYDDFNEQVELSPQDDAERHEYVERVGAEFGVPLADWTPSIPNRTGTPKH